MIPILDLSRMDEALARQLGTAFRDIGFVSLINHGVPGPVIEALYGEANGFFDLPLETKQRVARPRPDQNRGYIGYGHETLARLAGAHTPPDYKELFSIGPFDLPDDPYYTGPAAYPSFAPNLWPEEPAGLQPAMRTYWHEVTRLARRVRWFAQYVRRFAQRVRCWVADQKALIARHQLQKQFFVPPVKNILLLSYALAISKKIEMF